MNDINNTTSTSKPSVEELLQKMLSIIEKPSIDSYKNIWFHSGIKTISSATSAPSTSGVSIGSSSTYPNTEEVYKTLTSKDFPRGRNANKLYLANFGSGDIFAIYTSDNINYNTQEVKITPNTVVTLSNVYKVLIRTDTANTQYMLTELEQSVGFMRFPANIIVGTKTGISTVASQVVSASTPIIKSVTAKVRSLGTGSYISFGDSTSQEFRLTSVGDTIDIDYVDNLNKVYVITDVGNTGIIEYIGG